MAIASRPSHTYNAGMEHVGFSQGGKQTSRAPRRKSARDVFGSSREGSSLRWDGEYRKEKIRQKEGCVERGKNEKPGVSHGLGHLPRGGSDQGDADPTREI